jgi:hypothetical protein
VFRKPGAEEALDVTLHQCLVAAEEEIGASGFGTVTGVPFQQHVNCSPRFLAVATDCEQRR